MQKKKTKPAIHYRKNLYTLILGSNYTLQLRSPQRQHSSPEQYNKPIKQPATQQ